MLALTRRVIRPAMAALVAMILASTTDAFADDLAGQAPCESPRAHEPFFPDALLDFVARRHWFRATSPAP
jgi:hypothetical protein